jgi:hypothetical protein
LNQQCQTFHSFAAALLATATKTHALPGLVSAETVESSQWIKVHSHACHVTSSDDGAFQLPLRRISSPAQEDEDDKAFELLKQ